MFKASKALLVTSILLFLSFSASSQCGANTPIFTVDLSGNPDSAWISPDTLRIDTCCGAVAPDKCVAFNLTLDAGAQGIIFDICDGALPPGALFYQIACGPQRQVGEVLCLSGPGPHFITFCKPGNNQNKYCITSVPAPSAGPSISVNDGCIDTISAFGYQDTSIRWNSVFPGTYGQYNNLLSCDSACNTSIVTGGNNFPPFIDYEVCGLPVGGCSSIRICDTLRVSFFSTLDVTIQPQNPTICFGATSTGVRAIGSGGSSPYTFIWDNGQTGDSIQVGLGRHIVELNDGSGCPPTFDTIFVTSFANPITANAGNDTSVCTENLPFGLNGSVIAASGGRWSNGSGTFAPHDSSLTAIYTPSQTEINAGSFSLYLTTTGNGTCPPDTDTIQVTLVDFTASLNLNSSNISCFGLNDGTASASATGSNTPYQFSWDVNGNIVSGNSINNLSPGSYRVTATNSLGCTDTSSILITEPSPVAASIVNTNNISCNGFNDGSATVSGSGGTSPYSFLWPSGGSNSSDSNLVAGSYLVSVYDANSCLDTIRINLTEPIALQVSLISKDSTSCFGSNDGQASIGASGGTSPYSYLWPSGNTNSNEQGLSAGTYVASVYDANNCLDSISITIEEPNILQLSLTAISPASCKNANDGSAVLSASGGIMPYTYLWPSGNTSNSDNQLLAGTYQVSLTDAKGCTDTLSFTITEPNQLDLSLNFKSDVLCHGDSTGAASVSASGGTGAFTYLWPSGNGNQLESNLKAGTYQVSVYDQNGCLDTLDILINEPTALNLNLSITAISCFGGSNGDISISPSGGNPSYTYFWSTGSSNTSISNLSAGTYTVSLSDNNGCSIDSAIALTQPTEILVSTTNSDTICRGQNKQIQVSANGGTGALTYNWSNGLGFGDSKIVNPLVSTVYYVSTTDANGCPGPIDSVAVFVRDLGSDSLETFSNGDICLGQSTQVYAFHDGDLGPYTYQWNTLGVGLGPKTVQPNSSRYYIFTVTDACGIQRTDSIFVKVENYPDVTLPPVIKRGCNPLRVNFEDSLNPNPNTYSYTWNFGDGSSANTRNASHVYTSPGTYQVSLRASTQGGCESNSTQGGSVIVNPSPEANFILSPPEVTLANPGVSFVNRSIGANSYLWFFSETDSSTAVDTSIIYADTGKYSILLYAYNSFGCYDSLYKILEVNPSFEFKIPNAFSPNPNGSNGGLIDRNSLNNDVFFVYAEYVQDFNMLIFNRWGEIIFESTDVNIGWDGYYKGNICQQDVYVYKVSITWIDGSKSSAVGDVTLFR